MKRHSVLIVMGFLASCTQFPELDAAVSAEVMSAAYPRLLPTDEFVLGASPVADPALLASVEARAAALRARAEGLSRRGGAPRDVQARYDRLQTRADALRAREL